MAKKEISHPQPIKFAADTVELYRKDNNELRLRIAEALLKPIPKKRRGRPQKQFDIKKMVQEQLARQSRGRPRKEKQIDLLVVEKKLKAAFNVKTATAMVNCMVDVYAAQKNISKTRAHSNLKGFKKTFCNELCKARKSQKLEQY